MQMQRRITSGFLLAVFLLSARTAHCATQAEALAKCTLASQKVIEASGDVSDASERAGDLYLRFVAVSVSMSGPDHVAAYSLLAFHADPKIATAANLVYAADSGANVAWDDYNLGNYTPAYTAASASIADSNNAIGQISDAQLNLDAAESIIASYEP